MQHSVNGTELVEKHANIMDVGRWTSTDPVGKSRSHQGLLQQSCISLSLEIWPGQTRDKFSTKSNSNGGGGCMGSLPVLKKILTP